MAEFYGDVKLIPSVDGGQICYTGGQPEMDVAGLENAVFISLFTEEQWVGNALDNLEPDRQIGSDFEEVIRARPITIQLLRKAKDSAERALQWMLNVNIASEIVVEVTAPELNRLDIVIDITQPSPQNVENVQYQLNWVAGAINIQRV